MMAVAAEALTVEQWGIRLKEKWQEIVDNVVQGFIAFGEDLIEAKAQIPHGEWLTFLDGLNFSRHTAQGCMRMVKWTNNKQKLFNDCNLVDCLPPDYNTILQLTSLDDEKLKRYVADKTISPALRRNEIKTIINLEKVETDRKRIAKLVPRPGKYRALIVDPAWEYEKYSKQVNAKCGYARQSMEELYALNMLQWAEPNCHLWCWTTNAYIFKAIELVRYWGFELRDIVTWIKPSFGQGQYFRNATEHILFCSLGDLPVRRNDLPNYFAASRGEHSEKPEQFYDIVRALSHPPFGEMHQRQLRPDFTDLFMTGDLIEAAE